MPNKENIQKWVDALRSGKYQQTRKVLHNKYSHSYCCLGVACELYIKENTWPQDDEENTWPQDDEEFWYLYSGHGTLPAFVGAWLGLDTDNPLLNTGDCITANDDYDWDFLKIADAIEARYLLENTNA